MTTEIIARKKAQTVQVPLSELVSLHETTFNLPAHATRPIDKAHVQELAQTDPKSWPEIKVVETNQGLVILDGYHRREALALQVRINVLGLVDATPSTQKKALETPLDSAIEETVKQQLDETMLLAEIGVYPSEKDVAVAALTANLKHGKAPEPKARVFIALELWDLTRGDTNEPTQADIARIVGISRATLNEYLKKREKKQTEDIETLPAEGAEGEEAEGIDPAKEVEKAIAKARKDAEKFIKSLHSLYEESPQAYTEAIKLLFPEVVDGLSNVYVAEKDSRYISDLTRIFTTQEGFTAGNIPHITRLSKMLAASAKQLEKTHGLVSTASASSEK